MKFWHLLVLGSLLTPVISTADPWHGKVLEVIDGDTLVVLKDGKKVKVCLHGVDAPEKDQPFGSKAKTFASQLVTGKMVTIKDTGKRRGCQIVAKVYLGEMHLNEELLNAGLAWYLRDLDPTFEDREGGARKDKRGLWGDRDPVAPWTWRIQNNPARALDSNQLPAKNLAVPLTEHPPLPFSKDRSCQVDQDCVFMRKAPCACPPCRMEEGQVVNQRVGKQLHFHWDRRTCSAQKCTKCSNKIDAVCLQGQCALRNSLPEDKSLVCKADKDCVLRYRTPCECPPCGKAWRQASNRETFNEIKKTWSIKVPHCDTCTRCKEPTQWLGTEAVCIDGQCKVR